MKLWSMGGRAEAEWIGVYDNYLSLTEWQQGDPADYCNRKHIHQGGPCQKGELQGQDGPAQQEEQEEGGTGQVREGRTKSQVIPAVLLSHI